MLRRALLLVACAMWAGSCGDDGEGVGESPAAVVEARSPDPAASLEAVQPRYAVHEWGLIDVVLAGGPTEIAAGPGRPEPVEVARPARPVPVIQTQMVTIRKPVLYVHLLEGTEAAPFRLDVEVPGGRVVEHWPPAAVSERGVITWEVVARAGACEPGSYPAEGDARCQAVPDGYCEAAELERYETADGACITVDGAAADHLFYRGAADALELPLDVTLDGSTARVTWGGEVAAGSLVRLTRRRGSVRARVASLPSGAEPLEIGAAEAGDLAGARAAVGEMLEGAGLTAEEASAFGRAWDEQLFGAAGAVRDALLYVLPADRAPSASRLTFAPEPATLRRALVVRVDLSSPSTAPRAAAAPSRQGRPQRGSKVGRDWQQQQENLRGQGVD